MKANLVNNIIIKELFTITIMRIKVYQKKFSITLILNKIVKTIFRMVQTF